jgi:cytochrome c
MRLAQRMTRTTLAAGAAALLAGCGSPLPEPGPDATPQGASPAAVEVAASPPPAFAICRSCHAIEPGRHGVGPSMAGVFGQKAASLPGYSYSAALKESGLTWDAATLDRWLADPRGLVPGSKMVFFGMPDPARRKQVIDYLETLK